MQKKKRKKKAVKVVIMNNNNHQNFQKIKYLVILIINNTTSFVNPSQNIFYVFVHIADSQLFNISTLYSMHSFSSSV